MKALSNFTIQNATVDDVPIILRLIKDLAEYVLSPEMQKNWATEPVTGRVSDRTAAAAEASRTRQRRIAPDAPGDQVFAISFTQRSTMRLRLAPA
jgi:hypothetical protein